MRAVAIQLDAGADKADNLAAAQAQIEAALGAKTGGDTLISLPEMWTCLGGDRATKLAQSEALPLPGTTDHAGPAFRFLQATARRYGVVVHGGSIGERDGETLSNTSLVFDAAGQEIARYRKIHLFDVTTPSGQGYRESALFGAGDAVVTCPIAGIGGAGFTLGLSICYDLRFGELFLALRRAGAEVIMVPSAFTAETGRDHWEILLRARAIETQCWVIAAATTGTHLDAKGQERHTYGHSLICDPWGTISADAGDGAGFAEAEITRPILERVRAAMPVLAHRRLA